MIYLQQNGIDTETLGLDKIAYLRRRDRLAQAVCLAMGKKYDFWTSTVEDQRPSDPTVSQTEILSAMDLLEEWEAHVEQYLRNKIDVELYYEDLTTNHGVVLRLPNRTGISDTPVTHDFSPALTPTSAGNVENLMQSMRGYLRGIIR